MQWLQRGLPLAGFFAGAAALGINTQLGYLLVAWACAHHAGFAIPLMALIFAAVCALGGYLSWRSLAFHSARAPASSRFLSSIGVLSAILFTLVIALQGIAGLVLTGCER
jgi:hypothetical protein